MLRFHTERMMDSTYLPSHFNSVLSLPTVSVGPTVRVAVLVRHIREHSVEYSGVYRSCRLRDRVKKGAIW